MMDRRVCVVRGVPVVVAPARPIVHRSMEGPGAIVPGAVVVGRPVRVVPVGAAVERGMYPRIGIEGKPDVEPVEVPAIPVRVIVIVVKVSGNDSIALLVILLDLDVVRLALMRPIYDRQLRVASGQRKGSNQQPGQKKIVSAWQRGLH